ncbi:unnamed protein product [Urochloa humidicola]
MADIAFNSVGKVVEIALKIKEAVETVKHNEKECRDIQRCVARVSALLKKLDETTETMKDETMREALEDLAESLECALELVTECQRKNFIGRFLGSRDMAKKLDRVQNDIVKKLQLGNFAAIVQATIMVTNIQSAGGAPLLPLPRPPEERVVIDGFMQFGFSELKAATEDFLDKNIIAKGGSSTVYKGVLHDGRQLVAIKKVHAMSSVNDESRLYDEINIVLELEHKNIVRPLGYCHEIKMVLVKHDGKYCQSRCGEFCFIEEYMPNGSMNDIINGYRLIDWSILSKMILGIAQGLHYLHGQCVVHLDLKPANILLDFDMNPLINDFGAAKKLEHGDTEITLDSNSLVGTLGYMASEYIFHGIVSTKCDVYAFGITLLRTISTMCISTHPDVGDLSGWARKAREAVRVEELFDTSLCHKSQLMQIKRFIEVGLLCVEFDREDRPTMEDVLAMLNGEKELPALKQPWV